MKTVKPLWQRMVVCSMSMLFLAPVLIGFTTPVALAEVKLKRLDDPLTLQFLTPIDGKTVNEGASFKAALLEDHVYDHKTLPAGTQFSGTVSKTERSTHLANPGYVRLTVTDVVFPNGRTLTFDGQEAQPSDKLFHPQANNVKKMAKVMAPFAAVSAAIHVPIMLLTNWPTPPFTYAGKSALAVSQEFYRRAHPQWSPGERVSYGMLIGTGIPGLLTIASKRPEPEIAEGDNVQVSLDAQVMSQFFEAI